MIVNTITEAKAQLSFLVEAVQNGEEVIIKKAGKPVAILRAYSQTPVPRVPGLLKGKIRIADDFDELPPEIAEAFGMPTE